MQINVADAKRDFSKIIRLLESRSEDVITIARNGKPVAKITWIEETPVSKRIGIAKGKFKAPKDFDATNEEVYSMLSGGSL